MRFNRARISSVNYFMNRTIIAIKKFHRDNNEGTGNKTQSLLDFDDIFLCIDAETDKNIK